MITHARTRRAASVAALLTAVALLGLAAPSTADARTSGGAPTAKAGDPNYQRPVVGTCYHYSAKDLAKPSNSSVPVSCDGNHTALAVAVITPPDRVKISPKPGHQAKVFRAIARQCYAAVDATVGGTDSLRAKTAYSFGYFVPTGAQLAAGARWVRCDLIILGGRRLSSFPAPPLSALTDATQRCLVISGKRLLTTACIRAHDYRSTKTVTLHGKRYPSIGSLQAAARKHCAKRAGVGWSASWPLKTDWVYGRHRELVCYDQNSG